MKSWRQREKRGGRYEGRRMGMDKDGRKGRLAEIKREKNVRMESGRKK